MATARGRATGHGIYVAAALVRASATDRPPGQGRTICLRLVVARQVVESTRPRPWRNLRPRPCPTVHGPWLRGRSWRRPGHGRGRTASHDADLAASLAQTPATASSIRPRPLEMFRLVVVQPATASIWSRRWQEPRPRPHPSVHGRASRLTKNQFAIDSRHLRRV